MAQKQIRRLVVGIMSVGYYDLVVPCQAVRNELLKPQLYLSESPFFGRHGEELWEFGNSTRPEANIYAEVGWGGFSVSWAGVPWRPFSVRSEGRAP
jgi:hypothetical protein